MIRARILQKRRGDRTILGPLDLAVDRGELVAVVGPSGCGKTTLLSILAGIDRDFAGSVERQGRLGMVFQEPRLLPWRSVADNIRLAAPAADAEAALAAVGLAGDGAKFPGQLSLGMARRASLARALAVRPEVLLLDEPFVSLDEASAALVRARVEAMRAGAAIVMVTHDPAEAARADRVVRLAHTTGAPYPQENGMGPVKAMVSPSSTA